MYSDYTYLHQEIISLKWLLQKKLFSLSFGDKLMERFFDKLFVKVKEQEDCNKKIVIFFKFWVFLCFFFKVKK